MPLIVDEMIKASRARERRIRDGSHEECMGAAFRDSLELAHTRLFLISVACTSVLDPNSSAVELNAFEIKRQIKDTISQIERLLKP